MNSLTIPDNISVIITRNKYKLSKKIPIRYYTGVINDKQSILSFSSEYPVKQCAYFISMYRSKYGHYPSMCNDDVDKRSRYGFAKKKNINELKEELVIVQECSKELIKKCILSNLGLVVIHDFTYKLGNVDQTDVSFSAQEVEFGDEKYIYSIDELNGLLDY
jgi:hypothetical protein